MFATVCTNFSQKYLFRLFCRLFFSLVFLGKNASQLVCSWFFFNMSHAALGRRPQKRFAPLLLPISQFSIFSNLVCLGRWERGFFSCAFIRIGGGGHQRRYSSLFLVQLSFIFFARAYLSKSRSPGVAFVYFFSYIILSNSITKVGLEREREKSKGRRQKGVTRDFFIVLGIKARKRLRGGGKQEGLLFQE